MTDRCNTIHYPNGGYCVQCAEQEFIPHVPAHYEEIIDEGWNSGADTVAFVDGGAYFQFTVPTDVAGIFGGMFNGAVERDQTDPASLDVAFYLFAIGSQTFAQPYLSGHALGTARGVTPGTILRIEWPSETVLFKVDGAVVESAPLPQGLHRGGATLYRSGDRIQSPQFGALAAGGAFGSGSTTLRLAARGSSSESYGVATLRLRARGTPASTGAAHIRLRARGNSSESYGVATLRLRARGTGTIDPPVVNYGVATLKLKGSGTLHYPQAQGTGTARLRLRAVGSEFSDYGNATLRLIARGASGDTGECTIFGFMSPGISQLTMGYSSAVVTERIGLSDGVAAGVIQRIVERFAIAGAGISHAQMFVRLAEALTIEDRLGIVWRMVLAESISFSDTVADIYVAAERVVEQLRLLAGPVAGLHAFELVAEAIALKDALSIVVREQLTDFVAINAVLRDSFRAVEKILQAIAVQNVPKDGLRMSAIVRETIDLTGSTALSMEVFERLVESLTLSATFALGDDVYRAWVVNTETRAPWEYENYPFNSLLDFDGLPYGVTADGLYVLAGDKDGTDDINARVRVGLNNLGSGKEKRVHGAYLALRADGDMMIGVIIAEVDGSRSEHWYAVRPQGGAGGDIREGRVKFGRGLRTVHWDFELTNVAGCDFKLSDWKLLPMILDRRVRTGES